MVVEGNLERKRGREGEGKEGEEEEMKREKKVEKERKRMGGARGEKNGGDGWTCSKLAT